MKSRFQTISLVLCLAVGSASAAPPGYESKYKAAVKQEVGGDVVGALAAFEAIPVEKRDFDTRLHIASCHRKLGHLLLAEKLYEAIRTDPKADGPTIDTAASDQDAVRALIPRLVLTKTATASDVEVTLDGAKIPVPSEQRVDPGTHVIKASRSGKTVFERTLQASEGSKIDVPVDAPALPQSAPVTPAPAPTPPSAPTRDVPPPNGRAWGTALPFLGAGVALIGVAVGSRIAVSSATDDVRAACKEQRSPSCDTDAAGGSTVRRWEAISYVSGGLGLVATGIGIAILVRTPTGHATASLVPSMGQVNGLSLEGRF